MKNIERFLEKHHIEVEHILSAYSKKRKLFIRLDSGDEIKCCIPAHELIEILPEDEFLIVRNGTAVRKTGIISIGNDGIYTMIDGSTFQGTKRSLKKHKVIREKLGLNTPKWQTNNLQEKPLLPLTLLEKCSLLDDMPVAYCVIELVFDENGHGIDFIFRYCNKHMAVIEGVPVEDMLNHSFYEIFKNGDRKWLVSYADVALNGVQHTLHDYSPEIGKFLTIHCYQPEPGYCSCILLTNEGIDTDQKKAD